MGLFTVLIHCWGDFMISIAICDDDMSSCQSITDKINLFIGQNNFVCKIQEFTSASDFVYEIEENTIFNLIFLDIELQEAHGFTVAEVIRKHLPDALLIFVSNHAKYVFDAFRFKPFSYLPKPQMDYRFNNIMGEAMAILTDQDEAYIINGKRYFEKIPYMKITSIKQNDKYCDITKTDGLISSVRTSLSTIEKELPPESFYRVNRNTICNIYHVAKLESSTIIMDNQDTYTLPKGKIEEFTKQIILFWRNR